ncbi:hypothetical protein SNE40_020596 [Patella caerulea]|uniref:Fibrinogen C-terminal domain-containing protein n=1 Tax=Patella caerulea TaxID=87958 RepID=A0AAN8J5A6_PATCE
MFISDCAQGFKNRNAMGIKALPAALTIIKPGPIQFELFCNFKDSGRMVLLNRDSSCLVEDFDRTMDEYKNGFGLVSGNRWVGLERIYELFSLPSPRFTLHVFAVRSDSSSCKTFIHYPKLGDASTGYSIDYNFWQHRTKLGGCGNPFGPKNQNRFSTFDQNNTGSNRCAARFGGGWWFDTTVDCTKSFLTGTMDGSGVDNFFLDDPTPKSYVKIQVLLKRL